MGPFAMGDLAGLDVGWRIRKEQRGDTGPSICVIRRSPTGSARWAASARRPPRDGTRYEEGSRTPVPDPEIEALILSVSEELGHRAARRVGRGNPAALHVSADQRGRQDPRRGPALQRASDIDVVWLYGYGFPRYRGGPMFYADTVGVKHVYDTMSRLYDEHGEWLEPAPLLKSSLPKAARVSGTCREFRFAKHELRGHHRPNHPEVSGYGRESGRLRKQTKHFGEPS